MKIKDKKPPGQRIVKRMSLRTKYWLMGGAAAFCIGSGLSIFGEAVMMREHQDPFIRWFLTGSYAFILIIGGLGLLEISTRYRVMIDVRKEMRRMVRKELRQRRMPPPKKENPAS